MNPLFLSAGTSASWNLMSFLWSAGGEAVVEKATDEWRAAFNSPEAADTYEFYYRLVEADRVVKRGGSTATQQELESTGMIFGYVGGTVSIDTEIFGFEAVPTGPGGARGSEINANVLGIFSGIKDPAVRQAA